MNWNKLHTKEKNAIRVVHNKGKFKHGRHLFRLNKIFNVYQLNLPDIVVFMHNISTKTAPLVFHLRCQRSSHSYPTNFSEFKYLPTT